MPNASATPKAPDSMGTMSFLDHLEELRRRIIYSLVAVGLAFIACWTYAERIYRYMKVPIDNALQRHHLDPTIVYTNPTDPFNMYLKIGFIAALFVASPFVLYQVSAFIAPRLYRHERALRDAVHGLDGVPVPGGRVFRLQIVFRRPWIS